MAINHQNDISFSLEIIGISDKIYVRATEDIFLLCCNLLVGWTIDKTSSHKANIYVTKQKKYLIESSSFNFTKSHLDLISSFNQLLIILSYFIADGLKNFELIHGAAILENKNCVVVLGDKKSGKSLFVAETCCKTGSAIADDLLLINNNLELLTLGFPVRIRRPLGQNFIDLIGPENLLVGKSLIYVNPKRLRTVKAGLIQRVSDVLMLGDKNRSKVAAANEISHHLSQRMIKF